MNTLKMSREAKSFVAILLGVLGIGLTILWMVETNQKMVIESRQSSAVQDLDPGNFVHDEHELVIRYGSLNGVPVEMVRDYTHGGLVLRAVLPDKDDPFASPALDALKAEVIRLCSSKEPVPLGDTGYTFLFTGDCDPEWIPYTRIESAGNTRNIRFVRWVEPIIGNAIRGGGSCDTSYRPAGYSVKR